MGGNVRKTTEQDKKLWIGRMIKLEELHNLVKEHPFRTNNDNKYLVSYLELLDKFFKEFRKTFLDLTNKQYLGLDRMTHDLNATLWKCKKYKTITPIQLQYLEAGLTVYHHYMDYKECPCFYVLSKETIYCHHWSKKYQKYFLKLSDKEKYLKMQKDLRKLWGKQTGDIEEVINDSCNEWQYIYDNYDEIFNDDTETS